MRSSILVFAHIFGVCPFSKVPRRRIFVCWNLLLGPISAKTLFFVSELFWVLCIPEPLQSTWLEPAIFHSEIKLGAALRNRLGSHRPPNREDLVRADSLKRRVSGELILRCSGCYPKVVHFFRKIRSVLLMGLGFMGSGMSSLGDWPNYSLLGACLPLLKEPWTSQRARDYKTLTILNGFVPNPTP